MNRFSGDLGNVDELLSMSLHEAIHLCQRSQAVSPVQICLDKLVFALLARLLVNPRRLPPHIILFCLSGPPPFTFFHAQTASH